MAVVGRRVCTVTCLAARPGRVAAAVLTRDKDHPSIKQSRTSRALRLADDLARVKAMSVSEQMALADVKNRLSEVVDQIEREHGRVIITKHGRPAAVVLSIDDIESLEETLDVLSNDSLLADIREALAERAHTPPQTLSRDEALELLSRR